MRFQVPQNLDVSDNIIAGLNFIQIIYLGGSGGVFITLLLFANLTTAILLGAPFVGVAVFLAFYKHHNRSSIFLVQSVIQYILKGKFYTWKQERKTSPGIEKRITTPESHKQNNQAVLGEKIKALDSNLIFDEAN